MAGFFGFFDYSKPGKGVRKDEPKRSHFAMFWVLLQRKFWKMIQLNLIFILFCIPVVTIGPAIAGMTYVLRNFATESPVFLFSDFWDAFKNNFKQSFVYGLLCLLVISLIIGAGTFYWQNASENAWMYIPLGLILFMSLMFVLSNFYIFPMIVTLDLPLKALIKNGIILSILCLKSNLITLLFLALILLLFWIFDIFSFVIYIFIGFSFIGFLIVHNSYRGIKKFAIDPYVEQLKSELENETGDPDENVFSDDRIIPEENR